MMRFPRVAFTIAVSCLLVFLAGAAVAQETQTRTVNFEIISVNGNTITYKDLATGETKEFVAPADFKLTTEGRELGVADLKPGMKGTATGTVTTTHKTVHVTEVQNADVLAVSGHTILVRMADGTHRKFTEADVRKRNAKLYRDGLPVDLGQFRPGDKMSATIVTDKPQTVTEREVKAMVQAQAAPAPAAVPAAAPAPPPPPPAPAAEEAPAESLPKTGSPLPLVGLLGALSLAAGFGLSAIRRSRGAR